MKRLIYLIPLPKLTLIISLLFLLLIFLINRDYIKVNKENSKKDIRTSLHYEIIVKDYNHLENLDINSTIYNSVTYILDINPIYESYHLIKNDNFNYTLKIILNKNINYKNEISITNDITYLLSHIKKNLIRVSKIYNEGLEAIEKEMFHTLKLDNIEISEFELEYNKIIYKVSNYKNLKKLINLIKNNFIEENFINLNKLKENDLVSVKFIKDDNYIYKETRILNIYFKIIIIFLLTVISLNSAYILFRKNLNI